MSDDVSQPVEEEPQPATEPAAPEPEPQEPEQPPVAASKAQKRIQHLSARANEAQRRAEIAERERDEARALLAQRQDGTQPQPPALSQADVDAAAERKLAEREQNQRRSQLVNAGVDAFGQDKWNEATNYLAAAGVLKADGFLEAIGHLDNAHQVIVALSDDPDAIAELMTMRPVAMAAKLGRMSVEIEGEKKPALSKVPPPVRPVNPGRVAPAPDPAKMSTQEYLAWRKKTAPKHLGGQGQAA